MAFSVGIHIEEFKHLTPKKLGYCLKGYGVGQKRRDEEMWRMGLYIQSAVSTAVEHNLAGRKAKSKYIDKPLLQEIEAKNNKEMQQEEIERQRLLFISKMNIMKANFDLAKKEEK